MVMPCIHLVRLSSARITATSWASAMTFASSATSFSSSAVTRLGQGFEHLFHEALPALEIVQPLLDMLEPLVDRVQPLAGPLKSLIDLVPPLVAAGEAGGRGARLLLGGAGLLERVVDLDQHRAHRPIYGARPPDDQASRRRPRTERPHGCVSFARAVDGLREKSPDRVSSWAPRKES